MVHDNTPSVRTEAFRRQLSDITPLWIRRSIMDGLETLRNWLGMPRSREGFSPMPTVHDPFGRRFALTLVVVRPPGAINR